MSGRSIAIAVTAVIALVPGAVAAPAPPIQEESGTVVLPAPDAQDSNACFQGYARRAWVITQGAVNGPIGYVFAVDQATWGGKFKLEGTGLSGSEDLDIFMAADLGDFMADPTLNAPIFTAEYQTRAVGGEAGVVPLNTKHAIVCLFPPSGAAASWTYEASAPKAPKKK